MMKQYHAWFSKKAAEQGVGTSFYRSSKNGKEVEITCVVEAKDPYVPDKGQACWPDLEYRGLVTDYIRPGQRGHFDDL